VICTGVWMEEEERGGGEVRQQERGGERERGGGEAWQGLQNEEECQIPAGAKNRTDWACVSEQCAYTHTHTHTHTHAYAG